MEMEISLKVALGSDEGSEANREEEKADEGADVLGLRHGCQVWGPDG